MKAQPGQVYDRYTVEIPIGTGGMAEVYRVRHTRLDTVHALKLLMVPARSHMERLIIEGKVQASLRHPNIVSVTDVIDVDGAPGLVMEFVDGPSLKELLDDRKLTLDQVDAIGTGIIAGMRAAHKKNMIHRDLKPANVMMAITEDGLVPKITDFGLAKILHREQDKNLTKSGSTMGTPAYMAPEQFRDAKKVDYRADIFSLGALLYEVVTGKRAFASKDVFQVFAAIALGRFEDPQTIRDDIPERMINAINAALVSDPDERVQTCDELLALWTGKAARPDGAAKPRGPWTESIMSRAGDLGSGGDTAAVVPRGREDDQRSESDAHNPLQRPARTDATTVPPIETGKSREIGPLHIIAGGSILLVGLVAISALGFLGARFLVGAPDDASPVAIEVQPDPLPDEPDEPIPEPTVEPEPEPEPAPVDEPAPPPTGDPTGSFTASGDAQVWLERSGKRWPAGRLPPGTYSLLAKFDDGEPRAVSEVTVAADETVVIECSAKFKRCKVR